MMCILFLSIEHYLCVHEDTHFYFRHTLATASSCIFFSLKVFWRSSFSCNFLTCSSCCCLSWRSSLSRRRALATWYCAWLSKSRHWLASAAAAAKSYRRRSPWTDRCWKYLRDVVKLIKDCKSQSIADRFWNWQGSKRLNYKERW